jgi:D-glycero-D-manno-heptose 1,7-bisphosphate phosphatase
MLNKALFLDRDGVINHDPGDYTFSAEEFIILPTVIDALKMAQDKGFKIIIITNQGGIAKELYTHETVHEIHEKLYRACEEKDVHITAIYYSPDHSEISNSLSRKPESLMIERALARYEIDPTRSIMIGDRDRDVQCANKAGVAGIKIPTNAPLIDYVINLEA